jgi:DNA (cytosine-5)-methyltransferase 1
LFKGKDTPIFSVVMQVQMKAISLFSGCGGDTLGLERAGYKVVAFSEFNKAAIASHLANFPDSEHLVGPSNISDITKIPNEVFAKYKDQIDIVFAGFNCQGFSRAGKRKVTDPRNQLFQQFVRATDQIKPRFIIGENVTGLVSMKSGPNEDDPLMLDIIRQAFRQIGYELTYKVLEANEYGVPQKRKRILIVGWKSGAFDVASYWAAVTAHGASKTLPRMRSFVTKSMDGAFLLTPQILPQGFRDVALEVPDCATVEGKHHPFVELKANERLLSCSKRDSPVHSEIINLDLPSKTIICTYDHQPRLLLGLKKPNGHCYTRTLLPLELKQIQGFPAEYIITGSIKEQITQIGNAVPPQLVEAVATVLKGL